MINMRKEKTRRILIGVLALVMILAMVVPLVLSAVL